MAQRRSQVEISKKKTTVLIVDDHPIVRRGLVKIINREEDLTVCAQAEDAHQAMRYIRKLNPDLVIVDISLKDSSGIELISDIRAYDKRISVLILSMHDGSLYAERAFRAGAKGYVIKQEGTEKLIVAIRRVLNGEPYVSPKMADRMVSKLLAAPTERGVSPIDSLSNRELEVFLLIGNGHRTRHISELLNLSIKTIETYRAHIKEKLNLTGATELLQYAIQWVNGGDKP